MKTIISWFKLVFSKPLDADEWTQKAMDLYKRKQLPIRVTNEDGTSTLIDPAERDPKYDVSI